jgi:serine/threonine-protein kinase
LVDLALGTVGRAISQNRDPVLAQKTAASISNTFRQHSDALRHARQCLELDRSNAECELFAAGALDGLGQASEAEAFYLKAIELWPHQWLFYNRLGSFYFRHARYADAEKMFRSTVQTAPWNPVGYTNLAGLFLSGGRFGEAAELLETSNRLRPTGAGLSNLGTSYFYLRRYSEAAAAYEKSVQLEPNRHEWWRNLGDAYAETAQTAPKAEGCYQRALALIEEENQKLENPPRENLAAEAVYRAKLHDAAGTRRALAAAHIAPNEPALCFRKAVALELIGDRNGALQAGEEALHAGFSRTEFERAPEMQQLLRDPKYIQLKKN